MKPTREFAAELCWMCRDGVAVMRIGGDWIHEPPEPFPNAKCPAALVWEALEGQAEWTFGPR